MRRIHWPTVAVSALVGLLLGILAAAGTVAYLAWWSREAVEWAEIEPALQA